MGLFHVGDRNTNTYVIICRHSGSLAGSWIRSRRARTGTGVWTWDADVSNAGCSFFPSTLFKRQREGVRQRDRDLLPTASLPRCLQQLWLSQDKARSLKLNSGLSHEWQGPSPVAYRVPRSRKLHWSWRSWDWNSAMRCGCPKQCLHHCAKCLPLSLF